MTDGALAIQDILLNNKYAKNKPQNFVLWKYVLEVLKDQNKKSPIIWATNYIISQIIDGSEANDGNSFLLPSNSMSSINYWNEGINDLQNYLRTYKTTILHNLSTSEFETGKVETGGNTYFHFDAAPYYKTDKSYNISNISQLAAYQLSYIVIPIKNRKGEIYQQARKHDIVNEDIINLKAQTTEDLIPTEQVNGSYINKFKDKSYVRLLMPLYGQLTKIEDLNRNFWVISNAISTLTNLILGDESLKNVYKNIISEIAQMWENVFHLWLNNALLAQKDNGVRVIVLPITDDNSLSLYPYITNEKENWNSYQDSTLEFRHDIINDSFRRLGRVVSCQNNRWKLDLFGHIVKKSKTKEAGYAYIEDYNMTGEEGNQRRNRLRRKIFQKIKYLAELYPNNHLCVIPLLRINNYEKNYYAGEYYRYIYMLNRNYHRTDGTTEYRDGSEFNDWKIYGIATKIKSVQNNGCFISPEHDCREHHIKERIFAYAHQGSTSLFFSPASTIEKGSLSNIILDNDYACTALRTELAPKFKIEAQRIVPTGLSIYVYDAVAESYLSARKKDNKEYDYSKITQASLIDIYEGELGEYDTIYLNVRERDPGLSLSQGFTPIPDWRIRRSFYRGECPSYSYHMDID